MTKFRVATLLALAVSVACVRAAVPVVSNVRAAQRTGTHFVDILYDVFSDDNRPLTVTVLVSDDAGATWGVPASTFTGAHGPGVLPGLNREIVWHAGLDWPGHWTSQCRVRVIADDGAAPPAPPGMAYIPAGAFQMGDSVDGLRDALPVHEVIVNAFLMDKTHVSGRQWVTVYSWAKAHGYEFANLGSYRALDHPVQTITWYDAVKWCNARSEMEGLEPCYYSDAALAVVYRTGTPDLTNDQVKWNANGYRLPTEAEWEKAARGGLTGRRYPWGDDSLDGGRANYRYSGDPFERDDSWTPVPTTPVGYYNGGQTPAGGDTVNGYGLYDMAGNVEHMCWDWFSEFYYIDTTARNDPHGPTTGSLRVARGGSWTSFSIQGPLFLLTRLEVAYRGTGYETGTAAPQIGFRCVRGL